MKNTKTTNKKTLKIAETPFKISYHFNYNFSLVPEEIEILKKLDRKKLDLFINEKADSMSRQVRYNLDNLIRPEIFNQTKITTTTKE